MPIFEEGELLTLNRQLVVGRSVIDRMTLHYSDLVPLLDSEYPDARKHQERFGFRAILTVPLMREDRAIGAIILWRPEAEAFTDKQVALVKTFADQAALAIENVRLFNETKEALEQQTAISEDPAGDLELADRRAASAGGDRRARGATVRCGRGVDVPDGWQHAAPAGLERADAGSRPQRRRAADQLAGRFPAVPCSNARRSRYPTCWPRARSSR